jgi:rod shape determining protein RodA
VELLGQRPLVLRLPWVLLLATFLTAALGIYNLASASRASPLWTTQCINLLVGIVMAIVVAFVKARTWQRLAIPVYIVNLLALVALKFIGHKAKGAESWFALGPLRLQPAEFMKIGMVLMLAKHMHEESRLGLGNSGFVRILAPSIIAAVPTLMVLVQPDLGTALMMSFTALTLILFSGLRWPVWVLLTLGFVGGVGVLWNDYVRVQPEPRFTVLRHKLKRHQDQRISGWLDPTVDLKGSNYHALQSKIAVGSGGVGGKGWMHGTQTGLRYLPEQHTDFIFSVWAEEQGFVKCLLLLVLYATILLSSVWVAFKASTRFGSCLAVGVAAMIFWQVFENIGMVTGLLPITGITLPLLSYGGSSMVSVMIGIGLLCSVSLARFKRPGAS